MSTTTTRPWVNILARCILTMAMLAASDRSRAAETVHDIDIPAQSLGSALQQLADQSGSDMFYAYAAVAGRKAPAIHGLYTTHEALARLLAGPGLAFTIDGDGSVSIAPAPRENKEMTQLAPVIIIAKRLAEDTHAYNATHASTATKTDTPVMETPANIQVVPQQIFEDQQVTRIDKALQNVSSVNQATGTSAMQSFFSVRGFETWDYYRNGVRVNSAGYLSFRPTANLDRIEVLKGPASMLYGRIEPGGLINLVTKQPLATPHYSLTQQAGSFDYHRTTLDATGPVTEGDSLSYRLNLAYLNQGSFLDYIHNEEVFLAPILHWNLSEQTQANLYLEYQHGRDGINYGVPALGNRPLPVARGLSLQEPGSAQFTDEVRVGFNWSHAFNDRWTLRHRFDTDLLDFVENTQVIPVGAVDPRRCTRQHCTVERYALDVPVNDRHDYYTTVDLSGKFDTWGVQHTLLVGADFWHEYFLEHERFYNAPSLTLVDYRPQRAGRVPFNATQQVEDYRFEIGEDWYGLFLQDQITLPYDFHLLAGIRYDLADASLQDRLQVFGKSDSRFDIDRPDKALKPRFGLLWNPLPQFSLYGSYVENFGISNVYHGTDLPPTTAQQWEVGLKAELFDGRLNGSLAWFDLTKQNIATRNPSGSLNGPDAQAAVGEARNRGLELDISGEFAPGLKAIASYAYIDSRITRDVGVELDEAGNFKNTTVGDTGHRLYGVPRHASSLWITYAPEAAGLGGLKFGAGVVARSQRQANNANTVQLPGYAVLNLMTGYDWKVGAGSVRLQLNLDNLPDKIYFDTQGGGRLSQFGAPRTFLGSVRMEF